jgi:hypothetical protein
MNASGLTTATAAAPLAVDVVSATAWAQSLHADDFGRMEDMITWRTVPTFPIMGRSAWMRLAHPFEAECGGAIVTIPIAQD